MNQPEQAIKGYRTLNQQELDLINEGKELAESVRLFLEKVDTLPEVDKRCTALAKTNLQQGFMWATRSIAKPETF